MNSTERVIKSILQGTSTADAIEEAFATTYFKLQNKLKPEAREAANKAYDRWVSAGKPTKSHREGNFSVSNYSSSGRPDVFRVGWSGPQSDYRAIGIENQGEPDGVDWLWIGTHEDYNKVYKGVVSRARPVVRKRR